MLRRVNCLNRMIRMFLHSIVRILYIDVTRAFFSVSVQRISRLSVPEVSELTMFQSYMV